VPNGPSSRFQRIGLELTLGLLLLGLLFYHLYFRSRRGPELVQLSDPAVSQAIKQNPGRVLLIGMDGATWDVIFPLLGQGRMPNLAALLEHGGRGVLRSIPPLISPALWTTIATGQPREVHGITNFLTKQPYQYNEVRMTSSLRRAPALWNIVAGQGKKVGVVNWYAAYPAEPLPAGVFVAEGITPERITPEYIQPAAWVERIRALSPLQDAEMESKLKRWDHPVLQKSYDLDRLVAASGREILRREKPQLMLVYFQNIDVVSHGFWKYRFPEGLEYRYPVSPAERERFGDVIESYYEYTDRLIGELLQSAPGYTVFVVSDHGFAATYPPKSIFIALDHVLERLGYLTYEGPTCDAKVADLVRAGTLRLEGPPALGIFNLCQELEPIARAQGAVGVAAEFLRRGLATKQDLEPATGKLTELAELLARGHFRERVNWRKTKVFNLEDFHDTVQGLYLNLQNREPEGVVPEADYEKFRNQVCRDLLRLRTEDGVPAFTLARPNPKKRKMPLGAEDPPDLLVQFNREVLGRQQLLRGRGDPDPIPLAAILWSYSDVSGDHNPDGIWLVSGPATAGFEPLPAGILDLAPTILWLLGFPVGADMPGHALTQAFDAELQKQPVRFVQSWTPLIPARIEGTGAPLSQEKKDQFKALGYIQK
jgi:predicted AlkP superfamily phosphohydrolase/phosphomutase